MIVYFLTHNDSVIEFPSEELANNYKAENNLSSNIGQREHSPVVARIRDVTPRQIRQALIISGISLASIETAIDALSEPTRSMARVEWEYSLLFIRSNPIVNALASIIGMSQIQVDAIWSLAITL